MVCNGTAVKAAHGKQRRDCAGQRKDYKKEWRNENLSAYEWKRGSRIKADAQASGELMARLAASEEGLTAATLLEANKPENAPLHGDYTWDDAEAANEWRLHQGRIFISSIVLANVQAEDSNGTEEPVRAFHITIEPHKYEPIQAIVQSEDKYSALLRQARFDMLAFQRKYESLKELAPVFEAMKEVK